MESQQRQQQQCCNSNGSVAACQFCTCHTPSKIKNYKNTYFFKQKNVVSEVIVTGPEKETGLKGVRKWKQPKIEWPVLHARTQVCMQGWKRLETGSEGARVLHQRKNRHQFPNHHVCWQERSEEKQSNRQEGPVIDSPEHFKAGKFSFLLLPKFTISEVIHFPKSRKAQWPN